MKKIELPHAKLEITLYSTPVGWTLDIENCDRNVDNVTTTIQGSEVYKLAGLLRSVS